MQKVFGALSKKDVFCCRMRQLQMRTKCSDTTLDQFIQTFGPYLNFEAPENVRAFDRKLRQVAGTNVLLLNGCVGCNRHVFHPKDKREECPLCGHYRLDEAGKPYEVEKG